MAHGMLLFAELLTIRPDVVQLIARKRRRGHDREDHVQEVMSRGFARVHAYEAHPDGPRPWLFGIGRNVLREDRRAERQERAVFCPDLGDAERTASQLPSPEESACRRELRAKLDRAMDRLSDAQYLALVLVHVGGWSYEDVGEHLGIPLGTVQSRLQSALELLRREFPGGTDDYLSAPPPMPFAQQLHEGMPRLYHLTSAILLAALMLPSKPTTTAREGLYVPTVSIVAVETSAEPAPVPPRQSTPALAQNRAGAPPFVPAKPPKSEPSREELRQNNPGQVVIVNGQ